MQVRYIDYSIDYNPKKRNNQKKAKSAKGSLGLTEPAPCFSARIAKGNSGLRKSSWGMGKPGKSTAKHKKKQKIRSTICCTSIAVER